MTNNNGEIGMSSPYVIDAKPHGHGDVHSLMHSSGTAAEWMDAGVSFTRSHTLSHILSHITFNKPSSTPSPSLSSPRSTHPSNPGTKWIFFFQDTNGLAFLNLPALLGVSVTHELEVNSLAVPRMAKQVS